MSIENNNKVVKKSATDLYSTIHGKTYNPELYIKDISIKQNITETEDGNMTAEGFIICMDNCNLIHQNINDTVNSKDISLQFFENWIYIDTKNNLNKISYHGAKSAQGALDVGPIICKDGVETDFILQGINILGPPQHQLYVDNNPDKNIKLEVQLIYQNECKNDMYIGLIVFLEADENVNITEENSLYSSILNSIGQIDKASLTKLKKNNTSISLLDLTSGNITNTSPPIKFKNGPAGCNGDNPACNSKINNVNMSDFLPENHNKFFSWLDIKKGHKLYWIALEDTITINSKYTDIFRTQICSADYYDSNFNILTDPSKPVSLAGVRPNPIAAKNPNPPFALTATPDSPNKFYIYYRPGGTTSADAAISGTGLAGEAHAKSEASAKSICKKLLGTTADGKDDGSTIVINRADKSGDKDYPVLVELSADGTAKSGLGEIMKVSGLQDLSDQLKTLKTDLEKNGTTTDNSTKATLAINNLADKIKPPKPNVLWTIIMWVIVGVFGINIIIYFGYFIGWFFAARGKLSFSTWFCTQQILGDKYIKNFLILGSAFCPDSIKGPQTSDGSSTVDKSSNGKPSGININRFQRDMSNIKNQLSKISALEKTQALKKIDRENIEEAVIKIDDAVNNAADAASAADATATADADADANAPINVKTFNDYLGKGGNRQYTKLLKKRIGYKKVRKSRI